MEREIQAARDSLIRALGDKAFLRRFYDKLMASSEDIRAKFATTDFDRQVKVLEDSMYVMLAAAGTTKGPAHKELEKLAKRHSRNELDIKPEWYDNWLAALLSAIGETDPEYSPDVEAAWRASLTPGIELLRSKY